MSKSLLKKRFLVGPSEIRRDALAGHHSGYEHLEEEFAALVAAKGVLPVSVCSGDFERWVGKWASLVIHWPSLDEKTKERFLEDLADFPARAVIGVYGRVDLKHRAVLQSRGVLLERELSNYFVNRLLNLAAARSAR